MDEREKVIAALEQVGWVQAKAARLLDMTPRQIAYRIQTLNIKVRQIYPFALSLMELVTIRHGYQNIPAKSLVMSKHRRHIREEVLAFRLICLYQSPIAFVVEFYIVRMAIEKVRLFKFHWEVHMLRRFEILFKVGLACAGCAAVIGLAQAAPIQLSPISNVQGNTSWQDIKGTSYTFNDANHNGQVNVGETVTFTVDMHKTYWGVHDFDALKFWIDSSGTNLSTNQFRWDFDALTDNSNHAAFDYKPWTDGDKFFSFDYTFGTAGTYDLTGSVMCSADLSSLTGKSQLALATDNDWSKWKENTHATYKHNNWWLQGETEKYQLTVFAQPIPPVPEPETYAMLIVGLGLMGAVVRRRKANQ